MISRKGGVFYMFSLFCKKKGCILIPYSPRFVVEKGGKMHGNIRWKGADIVSDQLAWVPFLRCVRECTIAQELLIMV